VDSIRRRRYPHSRPSVSSRLLTRVAGADGYAAAAGPSTGVATTARIALAQVRFFGPHKAAIVRQGEQANSRYDMHASLRDGDRL
jgi:hypothetical protein